MRAIKRGLTLVLLPLLLSACASPPRSPTSIDLSFHPILNHTLRVELAGEKKVSVRLGAGLIPFPLRLCSTDPSPAMIARANGEIHFTSGLILVPLSLVTPAQLEAGDGFRWRVAPGWTCHELGTFQTEYGAFVVRVVTGQEGRIQMALLSHVHPFYEAGTLNDAERRVFHEGIIATDLAGQHEFSWGEVFCRLDTSANRDWLIVFYAVGPSVPNSQLASLRHLFAEAQAPASIAPPPTQ